MKEENSFIDCLSEKMLIYALGRGLNYTDRATVVELREAVKANQYRMSQLITSIAQSKTFQTK
jgi:hypothetical protein